MEEGSERGKRKTGEVEGKNSANLLEDPSGWLIDVTGDIIIFFLFFSFLFYRYYMLHSTQPNI